MKLSGDAVMKIVGKMICVFRDAAAVFLAAAAKRSAALRRTVGAANGFKLQRFTAAWHRRRAPGTATN